ncbi:HoxV [Pseudomonas veronii]|uniref:HoxV n=1 Tax=Pseudomonas veronii TaxID=76761 RepID=UPI001E338732|nr:HoxV [Pseudomonas veronii]UHH32809.1 HoxV [Pseudomonas veronii]
MTAMASLARLGGSLRVRPGQQPAIVGGRPALAATLLRGQPPQTAAHHLPLLYSLCGQAHRLTAALAVDTALHGETPIDPNTQRLLEAETRREHVRRMLLEWPRLLGNPSVRPDLSQLHAWEHAPQQAMSAWLGESVAQWLEQWDAEPFSALDEWSQRSDHWLAHALADCREDAHALQLPVHALSLAGNTQALQVVAAQLREASDFALHPVAFGLPCETGSWTRAREADPQRYASVWLRLGARLAELARLSLPQPAGLALGALALGPDEALAWSETSRGLLLHRVCLERMNAGVLIRDYQVIAPTEWNLHPHGALAQGLATMSAGDPATRRRAELLIAAFDPCIGFTLELEAASNEDIIHA